MKPSGNDNTVHDSGTKHQYFIFLKKQKRFKSKMDSESSLTRIKRDNKNDDTTTGDNPLCSRPYSAPECGLLANPRYRRLPEPTVHAPVSALLSHAFRMAPDGGTLPTGTMTCAKHRSPIKSYLRYVIVLKDRAGQQGCRTTKGTQSQSTSVSSFQQRRFQQMRGVSCCVFGLWVGRQRRCRAKMNYMGPLDEPLRESAATEPVKRQSNMYGLTISQLPCSFDK